ncbi:hypothetical protein NQ315_006016 [Exocentrus adspersus]|uniref:Uncharacterized protein n=1 Tax=Exocentrus adspersus TaxID=1586481 RepID=A0AAV8V7J1_9CUCU|nr:hypothetical protein NQ315_006016 [Exocentrus adspersus]
MGKKMADDAESDSNFEDNAWETDESSDNKENDEPVVMIDADEVNNTSTPHVAGNQVDINSELADPLPAGTPSLSREVLSLLGKESEKLPSEGEIIHYDLASQWEEILTVGLNKDTRTSLIQKYPPNKNCTLMGIPKLNPEAKAASTEVSLKRNERLQEIQGQLGASLAALGKVLTKLLGVEGGADSNHSSIEGISDACRLIADLHHQESEVRRKLLLHIFNKDLKEVMTESKVDTWLFGINLGDRIRTAKAMDRSGQDLWTSFVKWTPSKTINFRLFKLDESAQASKEAGRTETDNCELTSQPISGVEQEPMEESEEVRKEIEEI